MDSSFIEKSPVNERASQQAIQERQDLLPVTSSSSSSSKRSSDPFSQELVKVMAKEKAKMVRLGNKLFGQFQKSRRKKLLQPELHRMSHFLLVDNMVHNVKGEHPERSSFGGGRGGGAHH